MAHNDIWEHMGRLRAYAEQVESICEIGVRTGNSTTAFLAGLAKNGGLLDSYDIADQKFFPPSIKGVRWTFHKADSQIPGFRVESCELLFIDGNHKYEAVKVDLKQCARARRFVILHDTNPERIESYPGEDVARALGEFLNDHPEWRVKERFTNCNGLTVLERA